MLKSLRDALNLQTMKVEEADNRLFKTNLTNISAEIFRREYLVAATKMKTCLPFQRISAWITMTWFQSIEAGALVNYLILYEIKS